MPEWSWWCFRLDFDSDVIPLFSNSVYQALTQTLEFLKNCFTKWSTSMRFSLHLWSSLWTYELKRLTDNNLISNRHITSIERSHAYNCPNSQYACRIAEATPVAAKRPAATWCESVHATKASWKICPPAKQQRFSIKIQSKQNGKTSSMPDSLVKLRVTAAGFWGLRSAQNS